MKFLAELHDISLINEEMTEVKRNLEHIISQFETTGTERFTDEDAHKWDTVMDYVEHHIDDGDAERADAYMAKLYDILHKYGIHSNASPHHMSEECGPECFEIYEEVYVDWTGEILDERAIAAFRREGKTITRKFRCASGDKKGRLVANPQTCVKRKNPKRMVAGRKIANANKGRIKRKSAITLKTNASKMVRKANKRIKKHSARRKKGAL